MKVALSDVAKFDGMEGAFEIEGEIIRVFDKKQGEGEYGPWSFQRVILKDSTGEAKMLLKTRSEEMGKEDVGRYITITSKDTAKGHKGVKIEMSKAYKDKEGKEVPPSLEIVVTPAAIIAYEDSDTEPLSKGKEKEAVAAVAKATETEEEKAERMVKAEEERANRWTALKQLRKESIQETFTLWLLTVMESKIEMTPEVAAALIRVCGPNADTLFLSYLGKRDK